MQCVVHHRLEMVPVLLQKLEGEIGPKPRRIGMGLPIGSKHPTSSPPESSRM